MYRSALSSEVKRDSLFQDGLRRLRNMSSGVTNDDKVHTMSQYMNTIRVSGFDENYRITLLKGILDRQKQMEDDFMAGRKTRYRSRAQISEQKAARIGKFTDTWFLRGQIGNILKVPYTPGGKFKQMVGRNLSAKGIDTADKCGTKVVELAGKSFLSGLARAENFGGNTGCHMGNECLIHDEADCRVSRAIYEVTCQICERDPTAKSAKYIGTTGRTVHARSLEHSQAIISKSDKNPMSKHHQSTHENETVDFTTKILSGGVRFNLDRFIGEALAIESAK